MRSLRCRPASRQGDAGADFLDGAFWPGRLRRGYRRRVELWTLVVSGGSCCEIDRGELRGNPERGGYSQSVADRTARSTGERDLERWWLRNSAPQPEHQVAFVNLRRIGAANARIAMSISVTPSARQTP